MCCSRIKFKFVLGFWWWNEFYGCKKPDKGCRRTFNFLNSLLLTIIISIVLQGIVLLFLWVHPAPQGKVPTFWRDVTTKEPKTQPTAANFSNAALSKSTEELRKIVRSKQKESLARKNAACRSVGRWSSDGDGRGPRSLAGPLLVTFLRLLRQIKMAAAQRVPWLSALKWFTLKATDDKDDSFSPYLAFMTRSAAPATRPRITRHPPVALTNWIFQRVHLVAPFASVVRKNLQSFCLAKGAFAPAILPTCGTSGKWQVASGVWPQINWEKT